MSGVLYLVAVPIGNPKDISFRAIETLNSCNIIVCEEFKPARRLLAYHGISKELLPYNEHNDTEETPSLLKVLRDGQSIALISDNGTPVFSDPGYDIVAACISAGIRVVPVPGANSIIPALIVSGFELSSFYFCGWLPRKNEERAKHLRKLALTKDLLVIMETPYRLNKLLEETASVFGGEIPASLAYRLTFEDENIIRGTLDSIRKTTLKNQLKGEFVLVINNRGKGKRN